MKLDTTELPEEGGPMFFTVLALWIPVAAATELPPVDPSNAIAPDEMAQAMSLPFVGDLWVWDRYLGQHPISTHVCENIDRARDGSDRDLRSLKIAGFRVATGRKPGDPYIETLLAPARTLLRHPATKRLLELMAEHERENAPPDVFLRLRMGGLATAAALELIADRTPIEAACDRSYLLLMLLRTLRERPSLIDSGEARGLCHDLENGFAQEAVPSEEERARLDQLIRQSGVDPRAIRYDRELRSRMTLSWKGLVPDLKVQWMVDLLGGKF
jgi:hypothetical protein